MFLLLMGRQNVGLQNMFALCTRQDSTSDAFHPGMVREMDNSIVIQNGNNKPRFPGRLTKSIVEDKEGK
jgi:hypothetical protein